MRLLNFGGGGIAEAVVRYAGGNGINTIVLDKHTCDVSDGTQVRCAIDRWNADAILVTAGVSYPKNRSGLDELMVNLYGSMNVAVYAAKLEIPTILMASVAGMQGKPGHLGYAASKAGVISITQSLAAEGHRIWCVSPGRVDTPMRERDYPNDPEGSRLSPFHVAEVILDILDGRYAPGANVVIRRVGQVRVDTYEEPRVSFPSLSS